MALKASSLGFPRIGVKRELKKAVEGYWKKKIDRHALERTARELRARHWLVAKQAGIDHIPSNDFSLYDHILDMAITVDAIPNRYRKITDPTYRYFAMARGQQDRATGIDLPALEMTKWFDTNYHYIVPELQVDQDFTLNATKILREIDEARALGIDTRPVVPGPVTFLLLAKMAPGSSASKKPLELLDRLLPVYDELFRALSDRRVNWLQLDEPCLGLDLDAPTQAAYKKALTLIGKNNHRPQVMLTTYFGTIAENLPLVADAEIEGLHIDLVRSPEQLDPVLKGLGPKTVLSLGLIDGRNIWRTDLDQARTLAQAAVDIRGIERVLIAPSCSLLHTPVDLDTESALDPELKGWLSFATQKLFEIRALADTLGGSARSSKLFLEARTAIASRRASSRTHSSDVRRRLNEVTPQMRQRTPFQTRTQRQRHHFKLPPLPTTTIGSFPQTGDVRQARAAWRSGKMADPAYHSFLQEQTRTCIERQEALGLDVLVHGEFERADMVEYFGEKLDGFAFTENGWVQSYGSRCVKPPILYGDVNRPEPMTVAWSHYAQTLTNRPVKGMLTGPVTILQWSFVRDDQPRRDTCQQIALALRDEVLDLEAAGITMIQVDEPAIREGLPLSRRAWTDYLTWAVDAFLLATRGVRDETQIHTHMCYSEFGDVLAAIAAMDADVLSIETSRSQMELLEDFGGFRYPNAVGPGVYDIHSPRIPAPEEIEQLLVKAIDVLPAERLWVNPDCGLKTRSWREVEQALSGMVTAAKAVRRRLEV